MKRTGGIGWGGFAVIMLCLPVLAGAANLPAPATGNPAIESEGPYVVRKGDTLWGISKDLLQDPLLWPRLWEKNPAIKDPNLIYPGDRLTLPGKEIAPAPAIASPKEEPAKEKEKIEPKAAVKAEAPPVAPQEAPRPAPVAPRAPEPPAPFLSREAIACSPVLATEAKSDNVGIGSIVRSVDDRTLISMEDLVGVGLTANVSLNPGDRLAIVRPAQRLLNPQTGQPISRVLYILGLVEVKEAKDRIVLGRVSYSCGAISLGDLVVPYRPTQFPEGKIAQPTQLSVEGVVLDSLRSERLIGMLQLVFLNVGTAQGVGPGDVLAIYRPNPPVANMAGAVLAVPPVRLGEAIVLRVNDQSATAAVMASAIEVRIGDQVVLSRKIVP
jgi:LysM repeat protein